MLGEAAAKKCLGASIEGREQRAIRAPRGQDQPPPKAIVDVLQPIPRKKIADEPQIQTQGRKQKVKEILGRDIALRNLPPFRDP